MLNEAPLQIDPLLTATTGKAFTVTVETAVFEETHPAALTPVTEYEVVEDGLTLKLPPVIE
jgi:hypothetical protein